MRRPQRDDALERVCHAGQRHRRPDLNVRWRNRDLVHLGHQRRRDEHRVAHVFELHLDAHLGIPTNEARIRVRGSQRERLIQRRRPPPRRDGARHVQRARRAALERRGKNGLDRRLARRRHGRCLGLAAAAATALAARAAAITRAATAASVAGGLAVARHASAGAHCNLPVPVGMAVGMTVGGAVDEPLACSDRLLGVCLGIGRAEVAERVQDGAVARAAAEVATQRILHLLLGRWGLRLGAQQCIHRHDKTRGAEAAL
mmetsp:Transcript_30769/g.91411  ORF Transcript_30769/g.91411 Transcript_30769/m.91411 type:complete len:259 (-) Transcript_30769:474-1250(-)